MSNNTDFVDYYELLQVSSNAEHETIQRVFRLLAQRYHPDNHDTGNESLFQQLLKAYQVLIDPAQRAAYDSQHRAEKKITYEVFDPATAPAGREAEKRKREGILALLYRKRMGHPEQPGMNLREMEELLGIPREHLEFALWFLKENGDLRTGDNGRATITVKGALCYEEMTPPESERRNVYMLPPASGQKSPRAV